ncbi:MAG: hypothetical protein NVSMB51_01350 [Solirubrobacteraceae bacterium]
MVSRTTSRKPGSTACANVGGKAKRETPRQSRKALFGLEGHVALTMYVIGADAASSRTRPTRLDLVGYPRPGTCQEIISQTHLARRHPVNRMR